MTQRKPEHLLFLTGKLAEKSLTRTLESMAPDAVHVERASTRRERGGAHDGRDDRAAAARCHGGRPHPRAGTLPRRSGAAERTPGCAGRARPGGAGGPAAVLRQECGRPRPVSIRHADLRGDRGCTAAFGRRNRTARPRARRRWRRRHRPRLPAADAFPAPGRGGSAPEAAGLQGQRRFARRRRAAARRPRRRRLSAEPARGHAVDRRRGGGHTDPHSTRRRRPRVTGTRHRRPRAQRPALSCRPRARPDSFRLHRFPGALSRVAPCASARRRS